MSICPLTEDTLCPYCGIGLIGKTVTYNFRNPNNYLEGLVIITTYICLSCQIIIRMEVRDFSLQKSNRLAHHQIW